VSDDPLSRRGLLAVVGASAAGLAGCSGLPGGSGDDSRTYDAGPIRDLVQRDAPTRPTGVPPSVPVGAVERHRERARELLEAVPEEPAIPNGAVAERIARKRARVAAELGRTEEATENPFDRLRHWRYERSEAAELWGQYRAATGEASAESLDSRRDETRADLHGHLAEWEYRGGDPVTALAAHYQIERAVAECRRHLDAWPGFPERPADDVETVGHVAADVERARAALDDAVAIRDGYLDGVAEPSSYRAAIAGVAGALEDTINVTESRRDLSKYLDESGQELWPHDRDIENTPSHYLYEHLTDLARYQRREMRTSRARGRYATAVVEGGLSLAGIVALGDAVAAIRDGEHGQLESSTELRPLARRAQNALTAAWQTDPQAVSLHLGDPAFYWLRDAKRRLGDERRESGSLGEHETNDAAGNLLVARYYARAVPPVVRYVGQSLTAPSQ
jgi:hypothetical protein